MENEVKVTPGASYWLNCAKAEMRLIADTAVTLLDQPQSLRQLQGGLDRIAAAARHAQSRIEEHETKMSSTLRIPNQES